MELSLVKIITTFILPPGLMFSLMITGLILGRWFRRTGKIFFSFGIILLLLFSLPIVSNSLLRLEETTPALALNHADQLGAQAIVVLGGGSNQQVPEYQQDDVSAVAMMRVRYAALLQRKTHLPILASGGKVFGEGDAEASIIKRIIETEYQGSVRWVEDQSRTTYENATFSRAMLGAEKINKIILVTHALHMHRSQAVFERAGFSVIPAPLGFHGKSSDPLYLQILPQPHALSSSAELLHEWWGQLWYKLRY